MKGIEIINASAGSGKTYSLTERVIKKFEEGLEPEALMAITFTNKAAAELRERIRSELLKNNRTGEAQLLLDGFVGTVNAVCARLLSEYALDAGLSPALDVLPEEDGERLFKIAISAVMEEHAGSDEHSLEPVARRLSRNGGKVSKYQKPPDWRDDVRPIVDMARANQLDGAALRDCARRSWESLREIFGEPLDYDPSGKIEEAVQRAIDDLSEIENPKGVTEKALTELKNFMRDRQRGINKWSEWARLSKTAPEASARPIVEEVNAIAAEVLRHPQFQADMERMITGVFECAAEALEAYDAFKQKQGLMDFVDQETKVLELARGNEAFRASIGGRLHQLMVDEFQDTSPIQLALFLELNNLAGRSTWVGDPKQTIYSFRGADPQLMDEVTRLIEDTSTLEKSWRSCRTLVDLTNAVFSQVFHEMGRDRVCLGIPDERKGEADGGWLEAWQIPEKDKQAALAIAAGVRDLLGRPDDLVPADVAVLCKTHEECEQVAAGLEALGIRASATQGSLLETRECQLAMAVLKYLNDGHDDVALAEIVCLSPLHAGSGDWLASLMRERGDAKTRWQEDQLIAALDAARDDLRHWTPLEALEHAISKVELVKTIKSWPNAALRMSNLDLLRGQCAEYLDQCRARRSAATVPGFITYLKEAEPGRAQGAGEQTVQVSTYHGAKGLEWPVVILSSLDKGPKANAFGITMVPAAQFDPAAPLANRHIRFWPWPFASQRRVPELDERLEDREEQIQAQLKEKKDNQRLMYVGMTRARKGLVFAMKKKNDSLKTTWLDELTDADGNRVLSWPLNTGEQILETGGAEIPVMVREYSAEEDEAAEISEPDAWVVEGVVEVVEYPRARFSPSGLVLPEGECGGATITTVTDFGQRIELKGDHDGTDLGNAIHAFLGADIAGRSEAEIKEIAAGLLRGWGVEEAITVADLLVAKERLHSFIEETYPQAKILTEWPVTYRNGDNQLMSGWIDMLLELPEGYVIIDHKSYTAPEAEEQAGRYTPQLTAYKEAIEKATGKDVAAMLLHMPLAGMMFEICN